MFKFITGFSIFVMSVLSMAGVPNGSIGNKNLSANFDFCIPIMQNEIILDGKISSKEWDDAGMLSTFFNLSGQMISEKGIVYLGTDSKKLYIAVKTQIPINADGVDTSGLKTNEKEHDAELWKDDAVEIIIRNQNNDLFQFIVNSKDIRFDAKNQKKDWNSSSFQSKSVCENNWWTVEASISLEELGLTENYLFMNICRDWSRFGPSTITSGKSYTDVESMLKLSWQKGVPAVQMAEMALSSYTLKNLFNIYNSTNSPVNFSAKMAMPDGKIYKNIEEFYKGSTNFKTDLKLSPLYKYSILMLNFNSSNNVLLQHNIKIENQSNALAIPVPDEKILGGHSVFNITNYPGARKARFKLNASSWQGGQIDKIKISAISPDKNEHIFFMEKEDDGNWTFLVDLPRAKDGKWEFNVEYIDKNDKTLFQAPKALELNNINWIWADNKIGLSEKIISPFTPLEVKDSTLKCLLREHIMTPRGLWQQVRAKDKDILAGAIELVLQVNGKRVIWKDESIKSIVRTPNKVVFECISKADSGIELKTIATFDYDGMMWVKMSLNAPTKVTIDKMAINIPMKAEYCDLMHVFADLIRNNTAGAIPQGQGEVWNSKSIPKRFIDGKKLIASEFIPYMWIGGPARGICWFADCGKYFSLKDSVPAMRIKRPDKNTVLAEIDIINKAVSLVGTRDLEFGLQATPVKPQDPKALHLDAMLGKKHESASTINFVMNLEAVGFTTKWNKYPINHDYSIMKLLLETARSGVTPASKKAFDNTFKKIVPQRKEYWTKNAKEFNRTFGKHKNKNESIGDYGIRYAESLIRTILKTPSPIDVLMFYSDARLAQKDSPEFLCFKSEWHAPQYVGYAGGVRIYPAPSWIDFILWNYKKQVDCGASGIYLDDTYILPGFNPDIGIGGISSDGTVEPEMGILATREFIKRVAVMLDESPSEHKFIMVHHSDALIIPAFSFANLGFCWEDKYGASEFQERYPLDYIRAESTGMQCGLVSFTLNGIVNNVNYPKEEWAEEFKRLTRSMLSLKLLHQMKSYNHIHADVSTAFNAEKILFDFGAYSQDAKFVPYWEDSAAITLNDNENYKASYYTRQDEVLIVVSSINEAANIKLKLNRELLNLPANAVIKDLFSNKYYESNEFELEIPRREFTIVYAGSRERAEQLVNAKQRKILRPTMASDGNLSGKTFDMLFGEASSWQSRPKFLKNNVTVDKTSLSKSKQTLMFTIDNKDSDEVKGMAWSYDFSDPILLDSFKGFEVEYRTTNYSVQNRHSSIISLLPENANMWLFRASELTVDSKWHKIKKFFSEDPNREINRMVLHSRALPGTVSTLEIKNFKLIPKQPIVAEQEKDQGQDQEPAIASNETASNMLFDEASSWQSRPKFLKNSVTVDKTGVTKSNETLSFTIDNKDSDQVKGMAWALDITSPISLSSFKGFELEYKATNFSQQEKFVSIITLLPQNANMTLMRANELMVDSEWHKVKKVFSTTEDCKIARMILHNRTLPGTVSTFEIKNFKLIPK